MIGWSNKYIGIPYVDKGSSLDGADCWGLVRIIFLNERSIDLPSFEAAYATAHDNRSVADTLSSATGKGHRWPWKQVGDTLEYDVLLFRFGRLACHVGMALNERLLLHSPKGESRIERYDIGQWCNRLVGAYRYVQH
jgi:cell wall-associated NlpC family hydrolase